MNDMIKKILMAELTNTELSFTGCVSTMLVDDEPKMKKYQFITEGDKIGYVITNTKGQLITKGEKQ